MYCDHHWAETGLASSNSIIILILIIIIIIIIIIESDHWNFSRNCHSFHCCELII